MGLSPFHALYKARQLSNYAFSKDQLIPVFASSNIEIYPYQIAAATFALRSPYLKGVILCDDGSLGKSYEAMLVITQKWYEGKTRILIVVPTPLLRQWHDMINDRFSVPFVLMDNNPVFNEQIENGCVNPFIQDGLVITTYAFAYEKSEYIKQVLWDISVFEEGHHLRRIYTGENKIASAIREAVGDSFKLLLTATPMQNSIMDLYGLITFIDKTALPDEKAFYSRYFRKPENYGELTERVSKYCFRTTRAQVSTYAKIPERIFMTAEFALSESEQQLYNMVDDYLRFENKAAFPKMDQYDLTLLLFRTLSSSTFALERTLRGVVKRIEDMDKVNKQITSELEHVRQMYSLAKDITENAKGTELLAALKSGFAELKKLRANKKAVIFTENRATQGYIFSLLERGGYKGKVLMYNGDKSRDYTIMESFEKEAEILVTTDIAAEGFNLEFCAFVINYDLPYNTLTIEQRINRCHRQGQQSDVIVLSFLNRNNFADVRMLELVNKRILQFNGIFGMQDSVLGNIVMDLSSSFGRVLGNARTKDEIDRAYHEALDKFETENRQLVKQAEQSLFTSFTKKIAEQVTVTPQYIKDESKRINDDLWAVTKFFFEGRHPFIINDETRTVSCFGSPPKVFTGASMRRNEYSMDMNYQPRSGRHTITGTLAKNILHEIFWIGIPDSGSIVVEGKIARCSIGYYQIKVKPVDRPWEGYSFYIFTGTTAYGQIMTDEECRAIMERPVVRFTASGDKYGDRDGMTKSKPPKELDSLISTDEFIKKTLDETENAEKEELQRFRDRTDDMMASLEKNLDGLRIQVKSAEMQLQKDITRIEKLKAQKAANALMKELKQREQSLFFDRLRLQQELDEQIAVLLEKAKLTAEINRQFIIQVEGAEKDA